jgi:hypothetical protein
MYSEAKIVHPPTLIGAGQSIPFSGTRGNTLSPESVMNSYAFQVQFRLTLNRTHAALYSTKTTIPHENRKTTTAVWTDATSGILLANLQGLRRILTGIGLGWDDDVQPNESDTLLRARLRAKYYGGEYIILRPYLYNALRWHEDATVPPKPPFELSEWLLKHEASERQREEMRKATGEYETELDLPAKQITYKAFMEDRDLAEQFLWCCKRCIDAAMASTAVFDGVANPLQDKRLKVTNIHGTATA